MKNNYIYSNLLSIILVILIFCYILIKYNFKIKDEIHLFFNNLNVFYFVLSGLSCYIGAIASIIPYIIKFKKKKSLKYIIRKSIKYELLEDLGINNSLIINTIYKTNISIIEQDIIKLHEIIALSLIFVFSIIFVKMQQIKNIFIIIFFMEIVYVIVFYLLKIKKKLKFNLYTILLSLIRFILEYPRTVFTLLSVNLFMPLPIVFSFLALGSVAYYIPFVKRSLGILEFIIITLFWSLKKPIIDGFLAGIIFRANGLIFFIIPLICIYKNTIRNSLCK